VAPQQPSQVPVLLYKKEPAYTPEASAAGLEGKVTLAFTVRTNGAAQNITVVSGLGMGLMNRLWMPCNIGSSSRPIRMASQ